jgi:hypothetical protein
MGESKGEQESCITVYGYPTGPGPTSSGFSLWDYSDESMGDIGPLKQNPRLHASPMALTSDYGHRSVRLGSGRFAETSP